MPRKTPFLVLATALALAGSVATFWLASDRGTRTPATPSGSSAAPAPVQAADPPGALAAPRPAASAEPRAPAGARRAATEPPRHAATFDTEGARWLDGRVLLPAGTPADEELVLFAVGTPEDSDPAALAGASLGDLERLLVPAAGRPPPATLPGPMGTSYPPFLDSVERASWSLARVRPGPDGGFRAPFSRAAQRGFLVLFGRYAFLDPPAELEPSAERTEPVLLQPSLGAWLRGRLELPAGAAQGEPLRLAGTALTLGDMRLFAAARGDRPVWTVLDDGLRFELGGLRPGKAYTLVANLEGYLDVLEPGLAGAAGERVERTIHVRLGARVAGRVVDPSGEPLAGVQVSGSSLSAFVPLPQGTAETDDEGRFALDGLPPGKLLVVAMAGGMDESASAELELADGERAEDVVLTVGAPRRVAGRVVWPDGAGVPGAVVNVVGMPGMRTTEGAGFVVTRPAMPSQGMARTDDDGRFEVTGVADGELIATASAERDGQPWRAHAEGGPEDDQLVLELEPPFALEGRVVDEGGVPVAAFGISLRDLQGDEEWVVRGWASGDAQPFEDPGGAFRLEGVARGPYEIRCVADGFRPLVRSLEVPYREDALVLTLTRAASLAGRVVDPLGNPTRDAEVGPTEGDLPDFDAPSARSDEDGRFELVGLAPGEVELRATSDDWAPSETLTLHVLPGERIEDALLQLRLGGTLSGQVLEDGAPAVGATIQVFRLSAEDTFVDLGAETDAEGRFLLEHLAPGDYQVMTFPMARLLGGATPVQDPVDMLSLVKTTSATIREGETTHVVLGGGGERVVRLSGRVTRGGEPVAGGGLIAAGEDGMDFSNPKATRLDADGRYELDLDGPGGYTLLVSEDGGMVPRASFSVTVPDVPAHRLDLDLPVGSLAGVVRAPDGRPVAGVPVSCRLEGASLLASLGGTSAEATDDEGRFRVEGLRPGTYTVRADGTAVEGASWAVAVRSGLAVGEDGPTAGVELVLRGAGTLRGTVFDQGGRPVAGAEVFVRGPGGALLAPVSGTRSGDDGRFEHPGVPSGPCTVEACAEGLASPPLAVDVVEGAEHPVDLTLAPGTVLVVTVSGPDGELVRPRLRVLDADGRDHADAVTGVGRVMTEGLSSTARRVGPLPPGRYRVEAAFEGRSASRPVELDGRAERAIRLRLRD